MTRLSGGFSQVCFQWPSNQLHCAVSATANYFTGLTEVTIGNLYKLVQLDGFCESHEVQNPSKDNTRFFFWTHCCFHECPDGRGDAWTSELVEGFIFNAHKPQLAVVCKQTPEGIVGTSSQSPWSSLTSFLFPLPRFHRSKPH